MLPSLPIQISGLVLNQSYFLCPSCTTPHYLFGPSDKFHAVAERLGIPVLGDLPLAQGVSVSGDRGAPYALVGGGNAGKGEVAWKEGMDSVAEKVWGMLHTRV